MYAFFRRRTAFYKLSLLIFKWIWINYEYFEYWVPTNVAAGNSLVHWNTIYRIYENDAYKQCMYIINGMQIFMIKFGYPLRLVMSIKANSSTFDYVPFEHWYITIVENFSVWCCGDIHIVCIANFVTCNLWHTPESAFFWSLKEIVDYCQFIQHLELSTNFEL